MSDMTDLQRTLVAEHIAELGRERAAIRAEAARDHREQDAAGRARPAAGSGLTRRARLGLWLMALGERIAGPRRIADEPALFRTKVAAPDPCGDGDRLAPAA